MRTELLGQEKNIVRIKIEFEPAEFMANLNSTILEITKKANIPGFRKGRIPRKVLEMRFGKDNIYNEALEKMLPDAMRQVTEDYGLDIMGAPSLKIDDIQEGEPVTCELTIEVRPEVELPELEDIEVERLRQEVSDEDIDNTSAMFRKQLATLNPVDRAIEENDVVSGSFVTSVLNPDGGEASVSESQPVNIDLADPSVRKEVRDALLGKSRGDKINTEFDIEKDYRDASLAGRRVRYDIEINDVSERILPDMDPEFFKKVMAIDVDTEPDFKEKMKERLLAHQENQETSRVREEAIGAVVVRSVLDVPDSLMERQTAYVKEQDAADIKRRHNISMEEYLVKVSLEAAQYEQEVHEKAESALRRMLVLDEIGKKFGVEVKKEELEAEISRQAALHGMERARLRAHYYKDETNMSQLSNGLRYDKIHKLILDKIKIKDVDKLSVEEPAGGGEEREDAPVAAAGVESAD